jgi:hypothetical protein
MNRPEQAIHKTILAGLRQLLPHGWRVVHVPNKPRSEIAGAIEKSMGAQAGFPDLMILGRTEERGPTTYFLEVKAPKGRTSAAQLQFHDDLTDLGFAVAVVKSWEDALEQCRKWRLPLKRTFP